jgi:CRP-like cAMP-binding protein
VNNSDELFLKFGKEYTKGTVLFHEGDSSTEMYIIHEGKVKISKEVRNIEKTLVVLGTGEFFGEMATLNKKPRSASATVEEDSKLLVIDPETFEAMILNSNEVALRMIKKLAHRLQEADDQIENLLLKDNVSKVVNTLVKLANSSGEKTDSGIKIKITQKELASKVGVESEKIKEAVGKLLKGKIVNIVSDGLVINSLDDLLNYLDFLAMKEKYAALN